MVAPLILKIVAFSLAKKVVVFLVAKLYGFPRLYRRASEFNHSINRDNPKRREQCQNRLQSLFRLPRHVFQTVQRWRGVQPPQGPPSAPASRGTSTESLGAQHKQFREVHTRPRPLQASPLTLPNASADSSCSSFSLAGSNPLIQAIRTRLLGVRGGGLDHQSSIARSGRPFSVSACALLPFGVPSLVSPPSNESLETGSRASYSGQFPTALDVERLVERSSQGSAKEGCRRSSVDEGVGLSLVL